MVPLIKFKKKNLLNMDVKGKIIKLLIELF